MQGKYVQMQYIVERWTCSKVLHVDVPKDDDRMQERLCCYKCRLCASHEIIPPRGNDSLIINEGRAMVGTACAAGKAASDAREAAPRRSCAGRWNKTCPMDCRLSMARRLGICDPVYHGRACPPICCCAVVTWKCLNAIGTISKLPGVHGCLCCAAFMPGN